MQFSYRARVISGLTIVFLATFLLSGCFHREEIEIPAASDRQSQHDTGLGPGASPISYGLGEKGSPTWSPSGDRIAFTMDGYVIEKDPFSQDFERRTTKDFETRAVAWTASGDGLVILGADSGSSASSPDSSDDSLGVYKTVEDGGSLEISRVRNGVQAMAAGPPDAGWILLAIDSGDAKSRLALMESGGDVQTYDAEIEGKVAGISVSPDGNEAVLAVRDEASGRFEIHTFSFPEGNFRQVAKLGEGLEVFGDPQWTSQGIYYVAGEQVEAGSGDASPFDLYRIPRDSSAPEAAPGIGNDFVASNLKRDPLGDRLAIIGRRNSSSTDNLYILDLGSERLDAVTSNEDMEIRTGTEDLTWSPNGNSVIIVARTVLSEPKVYSAPADTLVTDFYNLYTVPTTEIADGG
ncbi:hypothetical protein BH24ACT22_BH24ACT22_03100 [soil metagenome]